jgi:prophage antirepressor-like protein
MKLMFVKQGKFFGTKCDFYVDEKENIYMSRTQIGYALQYKHASKSIEKIHDRHKKRIDMFSTMVRGSQIGGGSKNIDPNQNIWMYTERGIYEICRFSYQTVADDFYDWVYEVISSIRKNRYYIATERDTEWLGIREESKQIRRYETDQIKLFVEYAKSQGSRNADRYYMIFTKLITGKLGINSRQRDNLSQETLMELRALETLTKMRIKKLMDENLPYKEIYQDIKEIIKEI